MQNSKIKNYIDYIPIIILTIKIFVILWQKYDKNAVLHWKHYLGILLVIINYFLLYKKHQLGVISIGITLIFGLFGAIYFDASYTTSTFSVGFETMNEFSYDGDITFILWFIIHFVLSYRHYFGILNKVFWKNLFKI
jgi:hypothetical protein